MDEKQPEKQANSISFDPMHKYTVRRTGKQVMRLQTMLRLAGIIVSALTLLALVAFLISLFATQAGRFTVKLDSGKFGLTLSETADFANPTSLLKAEPLEKMDNITYSWLPDGLTETDGSHNGQNYIAYTFYVRNVGEEDGAYHARLYMESVTKNADTAVRTLLYRNDEPTIYAKPAADGSAEPDTIPFISNTALAELTNEDFKIGDTDKYTVVIYLEGEDPECVDDILGGEMKMSMGFQMYDPTEPASV